MEARISVEKIKNIIRAHRIDIIVVASLLLLSLAILLTVNLTKKEGASAEVTVDGVIVAKYPLHTDGEYPLNGGTNVLAIKDGRAYMIYSECPDHTCERTGKVKYVGEQIVCLPNKVSVKIIGSDDGSVDFVP